MPISESPSYHGYDVIDYRSVNPDYGTMADFTDFLDAAHSRGIKVIIDYVMNHCSNQNTWFQLSAAGNPQYRDYIRWSDTHPGYSGPWGQPVWHSYDSEYYYGLFWSGMPDLNYETPAVKDTMFTIADYWLNTVGVDGFRLDAVLYIIEDGDMLANTEGTYQFWHDYNLSVKQSKPSVMSVGEAWTGTNTILNYVVDNRLDYCFEFNLAYSILNAVNSGDAEGVEYKMQEVYNVYPYMQFGTFLTNHDQDRLMNVLGFDTGKVKAAASIYLTLPGIPYIYYGEEIGMDGSGDHINIRRPMQWSDQANAGFSTATPWTPVDDDYLIYNVSDEQADSTSLLNWYKKLIEVRNQEVALRLGEYEAAGASATEVMSFLRHYGDQLILVMVNTGPSNVSDLTLSFVGSRLQPGEYILSNLLNDDTLSVSVTGSYQIEGLEIDGYGALVYSVSETTGGDFDVNPNIIKDVRLHQNFPNPFNPVTIIWYDLPEFTHVEMKVYNLLGQEVTTLVDEPKPAGRYSVKWDGRNDAGEQVASGVYVCSLYAGDLKRTKKMLLVK
jgi:glycosidase